VNSSTSASVDPGEVEQFSALAAEWWDPKGPFEQLHQFNPVRVGFIRDQICASLGRDATAPAALKGLAIADVGCGGGLLCEPIARLGASVTGVDPSEKNIACASLHAEQMGLGIDYLQSTVEDIAVSGAQFDAVLAMEVLEHVADIPSFMDACAAILKPGGVFIGATLNRTLKSLALAKVGVEYILRWLPVGTHDWNKFITPAELSRALRDAGLPLDQLQGASYNPIKGVWRLDRDTDINYMVVAHKPAN
jgi:2-polyprenyl-6-hydroxyphenyl methylase / 3-demethylubiquinone-9 3-methyltransferase